MTTTINYTTTLALEYCCSCGIPFGMPEDFQDNRRRTKASFYCPNGHSQSYTGKSDEQRRREAERDAANAREEARIARIARDQIETQLHEVERANLAEQKRVAKRAAAGVCPCCKRSFVQLKRHMDSKHPEHAS